MTKASTGGKAAEASVIHLLHRAGQCADDTFAQKIGNDLTPRQFAVLNTVATTEGVSQTCLVEATGIDRSTMTVIIRRLVKRGLLTRKRTKQDARVYAVRLSTAGHRAVESAAPAAPAANEAVLSALPAGQRTAFVDALRIIVNTPVSSARARGKSRAAV